MHRSASSAIATFIAVCATTACASSGAVSTAAPHLAWELAAPTTAGYEMVDTARMQMDASGMVVNVVTASRVNAEVQARPAADGLQATVRVTSVEGSSNNSMGPSMTITSADVPGPAEITVTRTGVVDITQAPTTTQNFERLMMALDLYQRPFIRLPDRAVARGVAWTDTITMAETTAGLNVESSTVVTSVWERDTTVAGRSLMVITSQGTSTTSLNGAADGVQIEQQLTGTTTSTTLWDPQTRLIVERRDSTSSNGTTNVPQAGITGMPTSLRASSLLRRTN